MYLMLSIMSLYVYSTKNPVKLSTLILFLATVMFFSIWKITGLTWIPMILILLFTGGILIMFMILSTFYPNESVSKLNKKSFFIFSTLTLMMSQNFQNAHTSPYNPALTKLWFQNFSSALIILSIIILYFNLFLKFLKKEESCMKMNFC